MCLNGRPDWRFIKTLVDFYQVLCHSRWMRSLYICIEENRRWACIFLILLFVAIARKCCIHHAAGSCVTGLTAHRFMHRLFRWVASSFEQKSVKWRVIQAAIGISIVLDRSNASCVIRAARVVLYNRKQKMFDTRFKKKKTITECSHFGDLALNSSSFIMLAHSHILIDLKMWHLYIYYCGRPFDNDNQVWGD